MTLVPTTIIAATSTNNKKNSGLSKTKILVVVVSTLVIVFAPQKTSCFSSSSSYASPKTLTLRRGASVAQSRSSFLDRTLSSWSLFPRTSRQFQQRLQSSSLITRSSKVRDDSSNTSNSSSKMPPKDPSSKNKKKSKLEKLKARKQQLQQQQLLQQGGGSGIVGRFVGGPLPSIVGPEYIQVLQGSLFDDDDDDDDFDGDVTSTASKTNKNNKKKKKTKTNQASASTSVSSDTTTMTTIILCGESHFDSIDVTRQSGKFHPIMGWIPVPIPTTTVEETSDRSETMKRGHRLCCRIITSTMTMMSGRNGDQKKNKKRKSKKQKQQLMSLQQAKEWAKSIIEEEDDDTLDEDVDDLLSGVDSWIGLAWIVGSDHPNNDNRGRGYAYLLEVRFESELLQDYAYQQQEENDDDDDDDDDEEDDDDDEEEILIDLNEWLLSSDLNQEPNQSEKQQVFPKEICHWIFSRGIDCRNNSVDDRSDNHSLSVATVTGPDNSNNNNNDNDNNGSNIDGMQLFEWGDLDSEAHHMNKRRLVASEENGYVTIKELDELVKNRKLERQKDDNIWTFDDWFTHLKKQQEQRQQQQHDSDATISSSPSTANMPSSPELHLVIESCVPPWEVQLHRPEDTPKNAEFVKIPPASNIIREAPDDDEQSLDDERDPSNDGIGSYLDFVYRRFMTEMITEQQNNNLLHQVELNSENKESEDGSAIITADSARISSSWLHCVDMRDLGSEEGGHVDLVKPMWNDLLSDEEQHNIIRKGGTDAVGFRNKHKRCTHRDGVTNSNIDTVTEKSAPTPDRCLKKRHLSFPGIDEMNTEQNVFEQMKVDGLLVYDDDTAKEDSGQCDDNEHNEHKGHRDHRNHQHHDESNLDLTFPSFEAFFGQNTDFLYYSHHLLSVCYSPFLAFNVKSIDSWELFFTRLFLTGTIAEALSYLDLYDDDRKQHVYVRSPILKEWDSTTKSWKLETRYGTDEYIIPFLPYGFHLKAITIDDGTAHTSAARDVLRIESKVDSDVMSRQSTRTWSSQLYADLINQSEPKLIRFADDVTNWTIHRIECVSKDPKSEDDKDSGGEWFLSYLNAVHPDIFDDIDTTDPSELLKRNKMKSESIPGKTYPIGKIKIPSCAESFNQIVRYYDELQREGQRHDDTKKLEIQQKERCSVEVLSRILIDIWMHHLIDHCSIMKIGNIIANNRLAIHAQPRITSEETPISTTKTKTSQPTPTVIVVYMGVAHTQAISEFLVNHRGFKKRGFYGKLDWDDETNEPRKIDLPRELWDLSSKLFVSS